MEWPDHANEGGTRVKMEDDGEGGLAKGLSCSREDE